MRICYLHLTRYPTRLANPVQVMHMCAAMAELGHDVALVVRASESAEPGFEKSLYGQYGVAESFGIHLIAHHPFLTRGYLQHRQIKRLLRELGPDLIYSRTTRFARLWSGAGIPYVYETHAMPSHDPRRGRTGTTLFSENFRRLVVITHALASDFQSAFPELPPDAIVVAPDAAGPHVIGPAVENDQFRAGYVGHLYPGKGMETIAEIAPRLPEVRFEIVGGTPEDLASWRERTAPIENIRFEGYVPHREVGRHIAGFDLALAPFGRRVMAQRREISRWFSPLKIFEYMAQGKAIVAADLPVLRDVLKHGRNAWLVAPEDHEAWVDAVRRLRDDPALRERLGQTAFEDFERHYTWTARAGRVLKDLPESTPVDGRSRPR